MHTLSGDMVASVDNKWASINLPMVVANKADGVPPITPEQVRSVRSDRREAGKGVQMNFLGERTRLEVFLGCFQPSTIIIPVEIDYLSISGVVGGTPSRLICYNHGYHPISVVSISSQSQIRSLAR